MWECLPVGERMKHDMENGDLFDYETKLISITGRLWNRNFDINPGIYTDELVMIKIPELAELVKEIINQ